MERELLLTSSKLRSRKYKLISNQIVNEEELADWVRAFEENFPDEIDESQDHIKYFKHDKRVLEKEALDWSSWDFTIEETIEFMKKDIEITPAHAHLQEKENHKTRIGAS